MPVIDDWSALSSRAGDDHPGVPRTRVALEALVRDRPRGWEHLSWAALLGSGIVAQDRRLQEVGSSLPDREVDDYAQFASAALTRLRQISVEVQPAFDASAQVRAFGVQGEPGSYPDIVTFARRQLDLQDDSVMLTEDVRRVAAPDHLERIHGLLRSLVDATSVQVREYLASMVRALDSLPERLAAGESVNLDLTLSLVLDVDPVAVRRITSGLAQART